MICVAINLSSEALGQLFFDALLKRVGDEPPKSQLLLESTCGSIIYENDTARMLSQGS